MQKIKQNKELISYAIAMAILLLLLRLLEYKFLVLEYKVEIYAGIIAIIFLLIGIWVANKVTKPKVETVVVEKEVKIFQDNFSINTEAIETLKISSRELEVLQLMAKGLSNQEIADALFVSLHTIKTHNANLFEKLDVKRRTQAVEVAKKLQIITPTLA
ncbi:response regulator transcription factor [Flavobacterium solisilvae]|uniref:response regulator transcription factor n=1 Tax=Flavobacterium solisilvae TaxID=1852019 RepID=UPI001F41437B|nr:LuxR C-terminal-related transcriptional regulator [Flavobacterium solisilvae]